MPHADSRLSSNIDVSQASAFQDQHLLGTQPTDGLT
jgi:hypothetical protein